MPTKEVLGRLMEQLEVATGEVVRQRGLAVSAEHEALATAEENKNAGNQLFDALVENERLMVTIARLEEERALSRKEFERAEGIGILAVQALDREKMLRYGQSSESGEFDSLFKELVKQMAIHHAQQLRNEGISMQQHPEVTEGVRGEWGLWHMLVEGVEDADRKAAVAINKCVNITGQMTALREMWQEEMGGMCGELKAATLWLNEFVETYEAEQIVENKSQRSEDQIEMGRLWSLAQTLSADLCASKLAEEDLQRRLEALRLDHEETQQKLYMEQQLVLKLRSEFAGETSEREREVLNAKVVQGDLIRRIEAVRLDHEQTQQKLAREQRLVISLRLEIDGEITRREEEELRAQLGEDDLKKVRESMAVLKDRLEGERAGREKEEMRARLTEASLITVREKLARLKVEAEMTRDAERERIELAHEQIYEEKRKALDSVQGRHWVERAVDSAVETMADCLEDLTACCEALNASRQQLLKGLMSETLKRRAADALCARQYGQMANMKNVTHEDTVALRTSPLANVILQHEDTQQFEQMAKVKTINQEDTVALRVAPPAALVTPHPERGGAEWGRASGEMAGAAGSRNPDAAALSKSIISDLASARLQVGSQPLSVASDVGMNVHFVPILIARCACRSESLPSWQESGRRQKRE